MTQFKWPSQHHSKVQEFQKTSSNCLQCTILNSTKEIT